MSAGPISREPLVVLQNTDYAYFLGFANSPDGSFNGTTSFDFTGATAVLNVRQKQDVGSLQILNLTGSQGTTGITDCLNFSTFTDPVSGVQSGTINILIQNSTTVGLPPGVWYYDLNVAIGGSKALYGAGPFTVVATVAR